MELKIKTSGAAFCDPDTGDYSDLYSSMECVRILQKVIDALEAGRTYGTIMDLNGNRVGQWQLDAEEES